MVNRNHDVISRLINFCRYEYAYGVNPYQNNNPKIMLILIKRYPVVFPDLNAGVVSARSGE